MSVVRGAWGIVRTHRRAYIVLTAAYYGLVALAMVYVAVVNPTMQERLLGEVQSALTEGPLSAVGGVYLGRNVVGAAVLTFLVNLLVGAVLTITVPSLIVPFAGLAMGAYRAVAWGLLLAPTTAQLALVMIPHSLTLLLEGQGYILALLASYVHGMAFLRPHSVGVEGHRRGYVEGAKLTGRLYVLVAMVLAAAAVYEAVEVIAMVWLGGSAAA